MGGANERRTTRRYDLSLPVLVRIPTEKESDSKKGNTRDISTRGLYFVMDQDPQAGSQLDLVLTLPTAMSAPDRVGSQLDLVLTLPLAMSAPDRVGSQLDLV